MTREFASKESYLPKRSQLAICLMVLTLGALLLVVPRWTGWTLEHVHKEDGKIFLADFLREGFGSFFQTYTGYLHAAPRTLTAVCAQLPPAGFAGCIGAGTAAFRLVLSVAALAVFLPYAKSWRWALAAAAMFVAVPVGQQEALGNMTNLRWFCDAAALILLLGVFRRPVPALVATLIAVVCVLSDPLAVVLAPVALWRAAALTGWGRALPAGYLAASAAHLAVLQPGARPADPAMYVRESIEMIMQLLVRGPVVAQYGQNATELAINSVGLPLAAVAVILPTIVLARALRRLPSDARLLAIVVGLAGVMFLAGTLVFAELDPIRLNEGWAVGQASRYSLAPSILIGQALVLASGDLGRTLLDRSLKGITLGVLALAFLADSTGDPWNSRGPSWSDSVQQARKECDVHPSVKVPMTPTGVPKDWSADIPCGWLTRP